MGTPSSHSLCTAGGTCDSYYLSFVNFQLDVHARKSHIPDCPSQLLGGSRDEAALALIPVGHGKVTGPGSFGYPHVNFYISSGPRCLICLLDGHKDIWGLSLSVDLPMKPGLSGRQSRLHGPDRTRSGPIRFSPQAQHFEVRVPART
jgi:hypothetical protein